MEAMNIGRDVQFGTYRSQGLAPVDFDFFHRNTLPGRLREGVNEQVAWDVEGRAPIAVTLPDGRAYSYVCEAGAVRVVPGVVHEARTVLEIIDEESWIDYVYEFRTRYGLLYSKAVRFARGSFDTWDEWEPAIRCMYSGRPIYDPRNLDFRDRAGAPLDLFQRFESDDDPEDMSHFLKATGFLVVRKAFDAEYIDALRAEVDRIRDEAVEGELTSWWSDVGGGQRLPYRLTYLSDRSELIAGLYEHPRVRELIGLANEGVVPVPDRIEGILAVVKEARMNADASGFANLDFHTDCGFGACHLTCPCVLCGIQLDAMGPGSSQLEMIAGTYGRAYHNVRADMTPDRYPIVPLVTEPGDATVHYGCGLHGGPPSVGPETRRTLYVQHYQPAALDLIGPYQGYNQIMPGYGEGEILNIDEIQQHNEQA